MRIVAFRSPPSGALQIALVYQNAVTRVASEQMIKNTSRKANDEKRASGFPLSPTFNNLPRKLWQLQKDLLSFRKNFQQFFKRLVKNHQGNFLLVFWTNANTLTKFRYLHLEIKTDLHYLPMFAKAKTRMNDRDGWHVFLDIGFGIPCCDSPV